MDKLRDSPLWRFVAIVALVLLVAGMLVGVTLVLRNPWLSIIFGLTCFGVAAVAWRWLFGGTSNPQWVYVVGEALLLAVLVGEVIAIVRDQRNVELLLSLLVLSGLGLALAALLRRRYMRVNRSFVVLAGEKPFLIVNPKSGSGRAMKANIPDLARAKGIQVLMLEPGGSLTKLVQQAVNSGATILGMSGGDGSLGVAAAAAIRNDLPLVVLPGGTRCHFARDIGLDPEHIADSLRSFGGREVLIDVGEISGRTFLNNASFGLYADIVQRPGYRERKLGSALQVLVSESNTKGYPLEFRDADGQQRDRALMVLVGVNQYETLNALELGSRMRLDEGVLQVSVVYHLERSLLKQLNGVMNFKGALTKHLGNVNQWVAPEFSIGGESEKLVAGVDGELEKFDSPVHIKIMPRMLRLMIPPGVSQHRRTASTAVARLQDYALNGRLPRE